MIVRLAALILLSTLSHTRDVPEQMLFTVAQPGDDLTLTCSVTDDEFGMLFWYKLNFGYMVQTVASGTFNKMSLEGRFDKPRFALTNTGAQHFLHIRNVSKEDEATYFCQSGTAYTMKMLNGLLLAVNDHKNLQKPDYVLQTPETTSVGPGSSVNLQCSLLTEIEDDRDPCSEHRAYWFRGGSQGFDPGFVYSECINSEAGGRRSCVYSFSKTIRDSADAGTYYCAVVTCTEILFGEGTKVEITPLWPLLMLITLLGCCVIIIIIIFLIVSRKKQKACEPWNGNSAAFSHTEQDRTAENQPSNTSGETGPLNYVVLNFPSRRPNRLRNKVEASEESLYAFMRD